MARQFQFKYGSSLFFKYLLFLGSILVWMSCAEILELPSPHLAPRISTLSPDSGTIGTRVVISGRNFSKTLGENAVKFNGLTAQITAATDTQLVALVPAHAGTGKVQVTVRNLAIEGPIFTFFETPIISRISPQEGKPGTVVTLYGKYFDTTATNNLVRFGGKVGTVHAPALDSLLTVSVPADAITGLVTVTVNGITGNGPRFSVIGTNTPVHSITSISPTSGQGGTVVTITGSNFNPTPESNSVKFNGVTTKVTAATPTQLTVVAPNGGKTGLVSVTINNLTANGPTFTYVDNTPVPTITNYDPSSGEVGNLVAIVGTNFSTIATTNSVKFNGVLAKVEQASATLLKVTIPKGATTGPITVTVGTKTATGPTFTIIDTSPTITSFTPTSGPEGAGVTITGTNFGTDPAAIQIKFNGVLASPQQITPTSLITVVPQGATTGKITVTLNGKTATSADNFTVTTAAATWVITGSTQVVRTEHTATLLPNGKVLVTGGFGVENNASVMLATCELYDPTTGTWTAAAPMNTARYRHSATLLPNGKVLVTGGKNYTSGVLSTCELYDPATNTWTVTGPMANSRLLHQTILLTTGKVLVVGGTNENYYGITSACELYDPATGQWTTTGYALKGRLGFGLTLLSNGKVLVIGGEANDVSLLNTCELYDPTTGVWTATGNLTYPRSSTKAIALTDGSAVAISGRGTGQQRGEPISERYNAKTGTWSDMVALTVGRYQYETATLLTDGTILVAGGLVFTTLNAAERIDPTANSLLTTPAMNRARSGHTATLLKTGQVLVVGGSSDTVCEIFNP